MLDITLFLSFIMVSVMVIVVPGPNVVLIVSTALTQGRLRAMQTITGTLIAMAVQLVIAAKGTVWLSETLAEFFIYAKWLGALYLIYIGLSQLRSAITSNQLEPETSGKGTFWRGFFVGITNPKTILFFGAFLPQFTNLAAPIEFQIIILSITFLLLAFICDSVYLLAASAFHKASKKPKFRRWVEAIGGFVFVGAGAGVALSRRV